MNNNFIAQMNDGEEIVDNSPILRRKEDELVLILDAIESILKHPSWKVMKDYIFDGVVESLEKRLLEESKKNEPSTMELARLNGQLVWARKYSDLDVLANIYRQELKGVREQLKNLNK